MESVLAGEGFIPPPPDSAPPSCREVLLEDYGWSSSKVDRYESIFNNMDTDRDGKLSPQDLYNFYSSMEARSKTKSSNTIDDYAYCLQEISNSLKSDVHSASLETQIESIDLVTFALACENNKEKKWKGVGRVGLEQIVSCIDLNSESASENFAKALKDFANVDVTPEEAKIMLQTVSYMKNESKLNSIFGALQAPTFKSSSAQQNQKPSMETSSPVNKDEFRKKLFHDIRHDNDPETVNENDTTKQYFKPKEEFANDSRYQKYFKMLSVGIPRNAVLIKITQDGLDPKALEG